MIILIFFGLVFVLILIFACLIPYSTHFDMTREGQEKYALGTFKDFLAEYKKRNWRQDSSFENSHFSIEGHKDGYIHASIIRFGGVGMVLYPWSWIRFKIWENINCFKEKKPEYVGKWQS